MELQSSRYFGLQKTNLGHVAIATVITVVQLRDIFNYEKQLVTVLLTVCFIIKCEDLLLCSR